MKLKEIVKMVGPNTPPQSPVPTEGSTSNIFDLVDSHVSEDQTTPPIEARISVKVWNAPERVHTKRLKLRLEPDDEKLKNLIEFSFIESETPRRYPDAPRKTKVSLQVDLRKIPPFPILDNL